MTAHDREARRWWETPRLCVDLVRAPLTFGHSQLVLDVEEPRPEWDAFSEAASAIAVVIETFAGTLDGLAGELKFEELARFTQTSGAYIKTLVLRISANEPPDAYKVHLVPYFESHAQAVEARYREQNPKRLETGGLLSWLGERERPIDRDIEDALNLRLDPHALAEARAHVELFRLDDLAQKLRAAAPP